MELHARANSRAICSDCGRRNPGYNRLSVRRFEFIPLLGFKVFFFYAPRRVESRRCWGQSRTDALGSKQASADGNYAWLLARRARRLSWSEVAAQAAGKHDCKTGAEICGASALHSEDRQELPASGRVSAILVLHAALLGGSIFLDKWRTKTMR